ncbi:MAG: ABC transporter permease [Thermoleophilia bacterium]|nr:ABC transporter permease [Thermoleophilia bacterium]
MSAGARARRTLRGDKVLFASALAALLLVASVAIGPPILSAALGHTSDEPFPYATDPIFRKPVDPLTKVYDTTREYSDESGYQRVAPPKGTQKTWFFAGADSSLGRDELLRLLEGGRTSLEVAVGGTLLAMVIGLLIGMVGGFLGGLVDAAFARFTEFVMAFPLMLLVIAIGTQTNNHLDAITLGFLPPGVFALIVLIGGFTWFYPARVIRTQVAELRNREFVEAAVMIGAKDSRILRTHVLPHVLPTALVYLTLLVPVNVLLEAGITFLGVGIHLPTPSWGNLLSTTWGTVLSPTAFDARRATVWLTLLPSLMIFITVFTFNQLGEGLREAFDTEGRG